MKKGIICLGEALIDFIPLDTDNITYQKSPGGAPANVSVGLSKLGAKSAFLGKVGNDVLGRFLKGTLLEYGVDVTNMILSNEARTGVVFVNLDENGERTFEFYINPSADSFLSETEVNPILFKDNKIFHFGSISLISELSKVATIKAVEFAKQEGLFVSYDPNLRIDLWKDIGSARETIISMLDKVDILKISEDELIFISECESIEEGIQWFSHYDIPVIFVTLGEKGSLVFSNITTIETAAMKVEAVDTTGAGDAFVSGVLYGINEWVDDLSTLTEETLKKIVRLATISGGLAASKKGAMTALPDLAEIKDLEERLSQQIG
ncbi:aminoimidazole riboside kinase [Bacillus timonensis]|uniref:Aminoimidazole riboside kinase n=1 Tax=Bacillus timonensis TaxID=1033734 RepID=A0A4S3PSY9_9BACI|nr:aminoimidazole riboside kinase [Bacillus timonensis]THE12445.1 aminoimidazole riboside kinase [Bacillus timonensis]